MGQSVTSVQMEIFENWNVLIPSVSYSAVIFKYNALSQTRTRCPFSIRVVSIVRQVSLPGYHFLYRYHDACVLLGCFECSGYCGKF